MTKSNALVQARIDGALKERASSVLEGLGLTVSDVVRMLLTRIANEGRLPVDLTVNQEEYDAWFRAKVQEAISDSRSGIDHEEVEAVFAAKRAEVEKKALG